MWSFRLFSALAVVLILAMPHVLWGDADLRLSKQDLLDPVAVDSAIVYTIAITNAGPGSAISIIVTDTLPAGVTFLSTSTEQGMVNALGGGRYQWTVGTLDAGGLASWQISVRAEVTGTVTNHAVLSTTTTDPTTDDHEATETTTINSGNADLRLSKTDSADPVVLGDTFVYAMVVTNAGPQAATSVVVTDALPANVTFRGTSADKGVVNTLGDGNYQWTVGTLDAGEAATWQITVRADVVGTITNLAGLTASVTDPTPDDHQAGETTTIRLGDADLRLGNFDSIDPVVLGNSLVYTITVTNAGPDPATSVVVTDSVPAYVNFQGTSTSRGTVNTLGVGAYRWNVGSLDAGDYATWQITLQSGSAGIMTNHASLSAVAIDPSTEDHEGLQETRVISSMILDLVVSNDEALVTFLTSSTRTYDLLGTTNLLTGPWLSLATGIAGQESQTTITNMSTAESGIYRIWVR